MAQRKRTQQELVIEAFRMMMKNGELTRKYVTVPLATGGVMETMIWHVEPNEHTPEWIHDLVASLPHVRAKVIAERARMSHPAIK